MGIFDFFNSNKKKLELKKNKELEIQQNFEKQQQLRQQIDLERKLQFEREESEKKSQIEELKRMKKKFLDSIDTDENGMINLLDSSDFMKLLKKHQEKILDCDTKHSKSFTQNFIKISNYLKTKKKNIEQIVNSIKDVEPSLTTYISKEYYLSLKDNKVEKIQILREQFSDLGLKEAKDLVDSGNDINIIMFDALSMDEMIKISENQIYSYKLLLFHSLNMINSLIEEDMITFWEIYETLDKLNIFNSNWENEVFQKLNNIEDGLNKMEIKLNDILNSIQKMELNIVSEISNLSYITENSFHELNHSLTKELNSINSSISMNNLLSVIQTYQLYKINKNTKNLIN